MEVIFENDSGKYLRGYCSLGHPEFTKDIKLAKIFNNMLEAIEENRKLLEKGYYFVIKKAENKT